MAFQLNSMCFSTDNIYITYQHNVWPCLATIKEKANLIQGDEGHFVTSDPRDIYLRFQTNIFQSKLIYCRHFTTYSRCAMFDWSDTVFRWRNVTRRRIPGLARGLPIGYELSETNCFLSTDIATNENILLLDEYSKVKYFNTFFIEDFRK
jgi:hypothetical protein